MAQRTPTYNTMMEELQALLAAMQSEGLDVDEAIAKYERGQQLVAELQAYLTSAKNRVEQHSLKTGVEES